jgi:hypothetical protein
MSKQDLSVKIGAQWVGAKAIKQADTAISKLAKNATRLFVGGSILNFGKNSVQAFIESEKAANSLRQTLTNLGMSMQIPQSEAFIKNLSLQTAVIDDELVPAYNRLLIATKDTAKTQKILSVAIDVSKGTGKDLESVTSALAKAYLGNTGALQKLGVGLSTSELKAGSFNDALTILSNNFYGQASLAAESYTGQVDRIGIAYDQLKERIGKALLDAGGSINRFIQTSKAIFSTGFFAKTEDIAKIKAPFFNKSMAAGFGNVYDTGKLIDAQKKAAAAQLKATKAQTAEIKKQTALKKGAALLDIDQIQILAALQGKLTENEKLRLQLQMALLQDNATEAERLAKQLAISQLQTTGLAGAIANLPKALNPFEGWDLMITKLIQQVDELGNKITGAGAQLLFNMGADPSQIRNGALTTGSYNGIMDLIVPQNNPNFGQSYEAQQLGLALGFTPMGSTVNVYVSGSVVSENDLVDSVRSGLLNQSASGSFATIGSTGRVRDY